MSYEERFARAEASGEVAAFSRIDARHPVGIFLGLEGGQRAIMVVCPKRPPDTPSLAAIRVEARPRHGSEWALVLRLQRPELKTLFSRLVEDLDSATRAQPDDPGQVVVTRLGRWQRLFSRASVGLLEEHELRGLLAELDFLMTQAIPAVGVRSAVGAWKGPLDGPRDFVFDGAEVEVKAIFGQQRTISISSLEQLTDAGAPITLWTRVVEIGAAHAGDPSSVAAYLTRVRTAVSTDHLAAESFEELLAAAGLQDRAEYGDKSVRLGALTCYRVTEHFPRLQRSQVPAAILTCTYEVSTAALAPYRIDDWRRP